MVKMTGVMSLLYEHHSREFTTRKKKKEKTQTKTKDFENCFFTFLSPIVLCCSSSDYFVVVCYEQMLVRQVKTQMNCFLSFFRVMYPPHFLMFGNTVSVFGLRMLYDG